MVWQVILCGLLAVSESGDWSAIIKAQQLFHEVYGKKIEAAKTPEAKTALAKELLELAKKETDQLAKRVELEEAKKLAVEAHAIAMGIDIAKELASIPRDDLPSDPLAEADALWLNAQSDEDKLHALELFFRVKEISPLVAQKWHERIDQMSNASTVILSAQTAKLFGSRLFYEKGLDAINGWELPTDYMEWSATLRGGTYVVTVSYAADPPMAPESLFGFGIFQNEKARKPISYAMSQLGPSGPWFTVIDRQFGVIKVPKDGTYVCRFYVVRKHPDKLKAGLIVLRSITLSRQ